MASQNQAIDFETAQLIGDDFGIEVKQEVVLTKEDMLMIETEEEDKPEDLVPVSYTHLYNNRCNSCGYEPFFAGQERGGSGKRYVRSGAVCYDVTYMDCA